MPDSLIEVHGWELTARNIAAESDRRGQTIWRLQNRLTRWRRRFKRADVALHQWRPLAQAWKMRWEEAQEELRALKSAKRGDIINARARAGAARVEAEQAVERARVALKHAHGRDRIATARATLAAAEDVLAKRQAEEAAAKAAEAHHA